jgi:hypothetical protein
MRVRLVTYVPDYLVPGTIKYTVQGDGELDHAEIGCKMTAVRRYNGDQFLPDFRCKLVELLAVQELQVRRATDTIQ